MYTRPCISGFSVYSLSESSDFPDFVNIDSYFLIIFPILRKLRKSQLSHMVCICPCHESLFWHAQEEYTKCPNYYHCTVAKIEEFQEHNNRKKEHR